MKKFYIVSSIVIAVILIGVFALFAFKDDNSDDTKNQTKISPPTEIKSTELKGDKSQKNSNSSEVTGRYINYSESAVSDKNYSDTIVFFYAPWCPECRAFKASINDGHIPNDVQILETDYDSSTELKKQYGVTLQSTFVRVNASGELQKKWVGYGKDKSIATMLENVR